LELIAAVTALKAPVALQTRVGIATGLVVVGDLIGSGEAQERGIVGETPNLAARLQGIAEPNTVINPEDSPPLSAGQEKPREVETKCQSGRVLCFLTNQRTTDSLTGPLRPKELISADL
jgi:hypothetical protein